MTELDSLPKGYAELLEQLKDRIRTAQLRAATAVNQELIKLYWEMGKNIVVRQRNEGWGAQVTKRLSRDLMKAFPQMKGFSDSNLRRMRAFYLSYENCAQAVRKLEQSEIAPIFCIPWGHNIVIFEKLDSYQDRLWYVKKSLEHGWSRNILVMQIESQLHNRQGRAPNNFHSVLPEPQSDLAQQVLKDPYAFDFLTITDDAKERGIEQGLVDHIQEFLLELGAGFAFIGRQYPIKVDGKDYFIDLLFYHYKLKCFCVIELKSGVFKPEYAGKMNFYLSAVDDQLRESGDQPSIGMILCKEKSKITVEYALRNCHTPIGVSSFELSLIETLPDDLKGSLPSIEEIEDALE